MRSECGPEFTALGGLDAWYRQPFGNRFAEAEREALAQVLPTLFGYHAVCIDVCPAVDWLAASSIRHRCRLGLTRTAVTTLVLAPDAWPLRSDSLDLVVLPHVLESVAAPEVVVAELERVLIAEGHAVILGFNPLFDGGLWRLPGAAAGTLPAGVRPLGVALVRDWLRRHGFVVAVPRFYGHWPWRIEHWLGRHPRLAAAWPAPLGACGYLLLAKKRVSTLTLVRPRWRSRRRLIPVAVEGRLLESKRAK